MVAEDREVVVVVAAAAATQVEVEVAAHLQAEVAEMRVAETEVECKRLLAIVNLLSDKNRVLRWASLPPDNSSISLQKPVHLQGCAGPFDQHQAQIAF